MDISEFVQNKNLNLYAKTISMTRHLQINPRLSLRVFGNYFSK